MGASAFDLTARCQEASAESVEFLKKLVHNANISLDVGGNDISKLNTGIKAAQVLLSYGYGTPVQRVSGADGGPVKVEHSIDPSKLSTAVLKELLEART